MIEVSHAIAFGLGFVAALGAIIALGAWAVCSVGHLDDKMLDGLDR